jgi:hypothetical protein
LRTRNTNGVKQTPALSISVRSNPIFSAQVQHAKMKFEWEVLHFTVPFLHLSG